MLRFWADYSLVALLGAAAIVLLYDAVKRRSWYQFPYAIMAGLTSLLAAKLISLIYQPELQRPFLEQGVAAGAAFIDNPGFPSDHALLGTVAVLAVYALTRRRMLSLALLVVLLAMSAARVLALVHTPLDIVGGIALGCIGGLWYVMMPFVSRRKA